MANSLEQKCEFQQTAGDVTFCSANQRNCKYVDLVVFHQKTTVEQGIREFNYCSLNCNHWLYGSGEYNGN